MSPAGDLRVAVVHDWLTGMRGGEKVLEAILDLFPQAELFTLFHFPGAVSQAIEARPIHTSPLQRLAVRTSDYRRLLPLFPLGVRAWDFRRFDLVVSSSHAVAKGIDAAGRPHLCYCHTPMRYVWDRFDDYFPPARPLFRTAARPLAAALRRWDVRSSKGVTAFVANSEFVRDRIRRYYGRDAEVIAPFVDDAFLEPPLREERGGYAAIVSALVPYKKVELAIDEARSSGRRLVILGGGPMLESLRRNAPPNVELAGSVSDARILEVLAAASVFILPGTEDFGITPLEAMALGTPVVAYGEGGVLDTVVPGESGIFFKEASVESLRAALTAAEERSWDRSAIRARARQFTRAKFIERMASAASRVLSP